MPPARANFESAVGARLMIKSLNYSDVPTNFLRFPMSLEGHRKFYRKIEKSSDVDVHPSEKRSDV